jgi:hypothetical protein
MKTLKELKRRHRMRLNERFYRRYPAGCWMIVRDERDFVGLFWQPARRHGVGCYTPRAIGVVQRGVVIEDKKYVEYPMRKMYETCYDSESKFLEGCERFGIPSTLRKIFLKAHRERAEFLLERYKAKREW